MKLLVISPYFYPKIGGLENYAWNISKGLSEKYGWDIVVVTSNHIEKKYKTEIIEGIKIYRLPRLIKISNTPINPFWLFQLKKIIRIEKPDMINAHTPVPFMSDIAGLVSGKIPLYLTYHAGSLVKGNKILDVPLTMYEKFFLPNLLRKSKKIICVSSFISENLLKKFKHKCEIISPGVDTGLFKPGARTTKKNTILFIGNQKGMYKLKGLYTLISAIKHIPDAKLRIIGEQDYSKDKQIEYIGYKRGIDLVKEIQNSNIVVLPSAYDESFGMAIIEAMACKKPVIGSNAGGIPNVISDGKDGLIVPSNDILSLVKALRYLLKNSDIAEDMGDKGYLKIKKLYLWSIKINETYKILKKS